MGQAFSPHPQIALAHSQNAGPPRFAPNAKDTPPAAPKELWIVPNGDHIEIIGYVSRRSPKSQAAAGCQCTPAGNSARGGNDSSVSKSRVAAG